VLAREAPDHDRHPIFAPLPSLIGGLSSAAELWRLRRADGFGIGSRH